MHHGSLAEMPLSATRPAGWIRRWLELQRDGLTGHLEAAGFPYNTKLWACRELPFRHGAPWWPYEQTAYWVDGFTRCGYLLGDRDLIGKAGKQIEYVLTHADRDGYLGPRNCKRPMPAGRWSHGIFFRALMAHHSATGDPRVPDALRSHYLDSPFDHSGHRDVCNVEVMCWAFERTGDRRLLEMAEHTWQRFQQTAEDDDLDCTPERLRTDTPATAHGVTFCETIKQGAILYRCTGNKRYLEDSVLGFRKLDTYHMLLPGAPSSTESLRGVTALDAHETCDIADYTWSAGYLLMATGEAGYADRIERAVFNAHPGAVTKDFRALQYFSGPNQVVLGRNSCHTLAAAGGQWMCYRPKPGTECCTGEVNRIMPNYVSRMWLWRGVDPVAALYGPSSIRFERDGRQVAVHEETWYPFSDEIDFVVETDEPVRFTLWLRIPGWCRDAAVYKNGMRIGKRHRAATFVPVEGVFHNGDRVRLTLPMRTAVRQWPGQGISVERGPLVYALPVAQRRERDRGDKNQTREFPAWNMYPVAPWNYALCIDEQDVENDVRVEYGPMTLQPFSVPPVRLRVPMRRVRGWRIRKAKRLRALAGELVDPARNKWRIYPKTITGDFMLTPPLPSPESLPSRLGKQVEEMTLVPYGATLLRVAVFPKGR